MVERDLYDDLDLPRDASEADVRRAFRRQAKKAHPDAGGSPEKFGAIKLAHDVLIDPQRRAKYDKTGRFEDGPANNALSDVMSMIGGALDDAIQAAIGAHRDPAACDLKAGVLASLDKGVEQLRKQQEDMRKGAKLARRLAKRWRRKGKKGEKNVMATMLEARANQIDEGLKGVEASLETIKRAKEWLKDYDFDPETMAPPAGAFIIMRLAPYP